MMGLSKLQKHFQMTKGAQMWKIVQLSCVCGIPMLLGCGGLSDVADIVNGLVWLSGSDISWLSDLLGSALTAV